MGSRFPVRLSWVLLSLLVFIESTSAASLAGRVVDENGTPVSGARIALTRDGGARSTESGEAGSFKLEGLEPVAYELRVEKPGFYVLVKHDFRPPEDGTPVELVLNHKQEYEEKVDVIYAPPAIDLQKLTSGSALVATEVMDVPYSSSHEFRNGLIALPEVVQDNNGKIHLNGGAEDQVLYTLDGFNLTDPFTGTFVNRVPVDAIREVRADSSRYAAEWGKGSAGALALESNTGDDHLRYHITNFIPAGQLGGPMLASKWTPRGSISGPWRSGRAWFSNSTDLQYNLTQVKELAKGANTSSRWVVNDLLRNQFLPGKNTVLGSTLLLNDARENHYGLGARSPIETTLDHHERNYLFAVKGQHLESSGVLLELSLAASRLHTSDDPLGTAVYRVAPDGQTGNYFQQSHVTSRRWQILGDAVLPGWTWHGKHEWKIGTDVDGIGFDRFLVRSPFQLLRDDGTLWRRVVFAGPSNYGSSNLEQSLYVQDHWSFSDRVVFELGLRQDWNGAVGRQALSPRLALAVAPFGNERTKLAAGWGLFYDTATLQTLDGERGQLRYDYTYSEDGTTLAAGPLLTRFVTPSSGLRLPRTSNFSAGIDRKLPAGFYLHAGYLRRRTSDAFARLGAPQDGVYVLGNAGRDRYHALTIGAEHGLSKGYRWKVAYTRSVARSNAALDLALTNPFLGIQGPGPLPWDTPNRVVSSAWVPFGRNYGLAYLFESRSGYPFTAASERTGLLGAPNSYRYPNYFSLNVEVERVLHIGKHRWGLRGGFVNITNHKNFNTVNNIIESPNFLSYAGGQKRAFVTRIRLIGKD